MSKSPRFEPFRHLPFRSAVIALLVAVLPFLCFAAWVVSRDGGTMEDDAVADLRQRAEVAADTIAREAERALTGMRVLAMQERAQAGDVAGVRQLAETLTRTDPTVGSVIAFNRAGHTSSSAPTFPQARRSRGDRCLRAPTPSSITLASGSPGWAASMRWRT